MRQPGKCTPSHRASPLWPILLAGGIVAAAIAILRQRYRDNCDLLGGQRQILAPHLQLFRKAIVGVDKNTIMRALGPPPATVGQGLPWRDNTWYYPLDRVQQLALAIEFVNDVARQTEVLRSPSRA